MAGNEGVHATHCCTVHGCKYGSSDCPVKAGAVKQEYPCEQCTEEKPAYVALITWDGETSVLGVSDDIREAEQLCDEDDHYGYEIEWAAVPDARKSVVESAYLGTSNDRYEIHQASVPAAAYIGPSLPGDREAVFIDHDHADGEMCDSSCPRWGK